MDLSWCIICDRHCTDNNLYCSDSCQFQDINASTYSSKSSSFSNDKTSSLLLTPPTSPSLQAFYSFNQSNRSSSTTRNLTHVSSHQYQYFPHRFTPGSPTELSLFADDT
ncbi:hypothetical protein K501DRAFT_172980 [Backusella circina FSU 941]|nr:hypothetical protein K501DRAFT_172980 [Backusella circina FSU 941]